MTPDAFGRAIAVYPALLLAYGGASVTLSPTEALALLALLDSVDAEVTAPSAARRRTLWDPILSDAQVEFIMPCDADRPDRVTSRSAVAHEVGASGLSRVRRLARGVQPLRLVLAQ